MESILYKIENLTHGYGSFSLTIPQLEIHRNCVSGFSGPNGSGKSTLLRLLAFLEKPQSGSVTFYGTRPYGVKATLLQQDPYLLKRSVFDNVAYGLKVNNDRENLKKKVTEALEIVNISSSFLKRKWYELSGGEVKRVAFASRIVLKPEVLLLDEPTASIDSESSIALTNAIKWLRDIHFTTIIVSSHDMLWLGSISDSMWKLSSGKIIGEGNSNIIHGPWNEVRDNLWVSTLPQGEKIFATKPPSTDSSAILFPEEIMISLKKVRDISAVNVLPARVKLLSEDLQGRRIRLELDCSGKVFVAFITERSAERMKIIPGKKVYMIFKASSLQWI